MGTLSKNVAGGKCADLCRKRGISQRIFKPSAAAWRSKKSSGWRPSRMRMRSSISCWPSRCWTWRRGRNWFQKS